MIKVNINPFHSANYNTISDIRRRVFVEEQGIAQSIEFDGMDEEALHGELYVEGQCVGTFRAMVVNEKRVKIGRLAVLPSFRGHGYGHVMMEKAIAYFTSRSFQTMTLSAQTQALPFYLKLGFVQMGEGYIEAGLPHVSMQLELN